jgi:hypothetical protein
MDRILLKPGFHATIGCRLHAFTDDWFNDSTSISSRLISDPQRIASRYSIASTNSETSIDGDGVDDIESVEGVVIVSTAVYTVSGQLLQIVDGGLYSTSYLPNGMYILQHRMGDGSVRCEKVANYK